MGGRIQVVGDGAAALQSFYTVRVPSSRDSSRSARARPTMLTHDNIDFSTFSSQNCALVCAVAQDVGWLVVVWKSLNFGCNASAFALKICVKC